MKIGRLQICTWDYPDPKYKKFIYFQYLKGSCKCKFLTILNILFHLNSKQCIKEIEEDKDNP